MIMLTDRLIRPPGHQFDSIQFTDRYGEAGPPPFLFGCHGDCEAMGFYPEPNAQYWPKPPPSLLGDHQYEVGEERQLLSKKTTLVYVGPGWHMLDPETREIWETEFDFNRFVEAVKNRNYWVPKSGVEDGWAFVLCPQCNGAGSVSRGEAVRRVPQLLWRLLRGIWNPGGPEDVARWRLRLWHAEYWLRQFIKLFTYKEVSP
jgi:hypothetical protein